MRSLGPILGIETNALRDPRLPTLYVFQGNHPLSPYGKRILVRLQDRSKKAMTEAFKYDSKLEVPAGDDEHMASLGEFWLLISILSEITNPRLGLLELFPGDVIFSRDKEGTGDPIDDIMAIWVTGPCVLFAYFLCCFN